MGGLTAAVADPLPPAARALWRRHAPDGLALAFPDESGWSGAEVLLTKRATVDAALLASLPALRLVQQVGRFPTLVDLPACRVRGVPVAIWPLVSRITVAEHAVALMLAIARCLGEGERATRAAAYREKGITPVRTTETVIAWNWMQLPIIELYGKTLGLVGAGAIALEVAARARAFGVQLAYCTRRRLSAAWERRLGLTCWSLNDLLARGDFVSLHLPFAPETEGLMGRAQFSRMKPGAVFINTARGGLVDEAALCEALQSGRLRGAGLDVYVEEPLPAGHPLLGLPNVFLAPHTGGGEAGGLPADLMRLFAHLREVGEGAPPAAIMNWDPWGDE